MAGSLHDLDVHRVSAKLARRVIGLTKTFGLRHLKLRDQLQRSSSSVFLNLSEGLARVSPGEKKRAFSIARGEAIETRAALDLALIHGLITEADHDECDQLADRASAMLWKLIARYSS